MDRKLDAGRAWLPLSNKGCHRGRNANAWFSAAFGTVQKKEESCRLEEAQIKGD